jgi:predicted TIM-barrel fold metal-dependent hydrolase|tara:strand:+ start:196 stop:495 length:300 start_codon:yes stop_codon:yes gene_type:complete
MKNFDSWLCYNSSSDDGQAIIDDRTNELIKTTYKPANLIMDAVSEFTIKENQQIAEFINENDMTGLGNYIYLKAYDYAHKISEHQAEQEFENGELNDQN